MPTGDRTLITVITVVYNAANTLRATIESIIPHLSEEVKYIIIDGDSTDGTKDLIRLYESHLVFWISESDKGIYDAMNKGWNAAPVGSYILYIGAGDKLFSLPSRIELVDQLGQMLPVILGSCALGDQVMFVSCWDNGMRLRNTAHHQALMIYKSSSEASPFDVGLNVYADWDFNLRLFRRGVQALYLGSLRSYAEPGGVSWHHNLKEIWIVANRHGGPILGLLAWLLNWISLFRRKYLKAKRDFS